MPKKIQLCQFLASLLLAVLIFPGASAQFGNTYYHMFGIPQANQLNPAFQPVCNGYIGLPLLSPLKFQIESDPLTFGDVFEYKSAEKKYITFLHPDGNRQKFLDALKPLNVVRYELASPILSIGWRKEKLYFTLDLSERLMHGFTFTEDFARFLINGNLDQSNFDFSDLGMNISHFHSFAIGVSYNQDDEILLGIKAKLLLGTANLTSRSSIINMDTSPLEWRVRSEVEMDASIPYLEEVPLDSEGYLDVENLADTALDPFFGFPEDPVDLLKGEGLKTIGGIRNPGFAVDLGFSYRPIEQLSISASLVDLGFIRWKNYVYNFQQDIDFTFEGLEFRLEEDYTPGESLLDSLQQDLQIKVSEKPYTTMLTGKVYLGAAFNLTDRVRFGGVFRTRVYRYHFYNQFTVSANVRPISMLSASLSYSIYGKSYMNLGFGLSLHAGPFNLYFVTDQMPSAYFFPKEFSSLNFRLGVNIAWGCSLRKKAIKDRPMLD